MSQYIGKVLANDKLVSFYQIKENDHIIFMLSVCYFKHLLFFCYSYILFEF